MFLLVSVRHVGAHLDGHLHGVSWRGLCLFTSFNLPDSGLYLLNSFDFDFSILNDATLKTSDCLLCNNRFLSITQRVSPPRYVTILPLEPLHYPLLVRQLIMPSFLLPTLTLTEGRSMGSCRGLWFLNEQSLQSTVSTVSLSLNLQWKSVLPDSKLSIWSQFKNVRPLPFRIVALAFVTYLQNDSIGDLQFLWER